MPRKPRPNRAARPAPRSGARAAPPEDPVTRAVRRAVRWLETAERTRAEVRERLTAAGFSAAVTAEALDRLGPLVDDARAAEALAHKLTRRGPAARRLLQDSIEARGVDPGIAERVARHTTPKGDRAAAFEAARRAALRLPDSLDAHARWRRVLGALARAGFDEELARDAAAVALGAAPDEWA